MRSRTQNGFTLIELMIVVAIIGILAAISMPMFANLVAKSQESTTKGNLGTLRSALAIYYGDMEGYYPAGILSTSLTTGGKYVSQIPLAYMPKTPECVGHPASHLTFTYIQGAIEPTFAAYVKNIENTVGGGGWAYDATGPDSASWGAVIPLCNHDDLRGQTWSSF